MRIALSDPRIRAAFLSSVILISAADFYFSARSFAAAAFSISSNPESWAVAVRLEPGNAAYSERLGLYRFYALEHRDLAEAERDLERATQLDPSSARLQLDLASLEEVRGDMARAHRAYDTAQQDYPISADVAWRYGSFLLRQGDTAAAFRQIKHALQHNPSLEPSALSECWQVNPDANTIVDQVLPPTPEAYLSALDYFVSQSELPAAQVVWSRVLGLNESFPMKRTLPLIDALLSKDHVDDAEDVWSQALLATKWLVDSTSSQSLIFNGGFENDALDGGFDWSELPSVGVALAFDNQIVHSGKRALRVDFSGDSNLNFEHVYQYVAIQPGQQYRFSAFLRTEGISSNSGIRFEIVDPRRPQKLQVLTPSLTGTNPWTEVNTDVRAAADTDLIEIILRRLPSRSLDNKLRGTVWVDDVALTPISPEPTGSKN